MDFWCICIAYYSYWSDVTVFFSFVFLSFCFSFFSAKTHTHTTTLFLAFTLNYTILYFFFHFFSFLLGAALAHGFLYFSSFPCWFHWKCSDFCWRNNNNNYNNNINVIIYALTKCACVSWVCVKTANFSSIAWDSANSRTTVCNFSMLHIFSFFSLVFYYSIHFIISSFISSSSPSSPHVPLQITKS